MRRSKKTSKFCVTGLCDSPVNFLAQKASDVENVCIWQHNRRFFLSSKCFFCCPWEAQAKFKDGSSSSMTESTSGSHLWPSLGLFTSIKQWVNHHHAPLRYSTNTRISAKEPLSTVYFLMSLWLLANILHNSCPTSPVSDSANPVLTGYSPPRGATSYWIVSLTRGPYLAILSWWQRPSWTLPNPLQNSSQQTQDTQPTARTGTRDSSWLILVFGWR